jgi:hypothetical protein
MASNRGGLIQWKPVQRLRVVSGCFHKHILSELKILPVTMVTMSTNSLSFHVDGWILLGVQHLSMKNQLLHVLFSAHEYLTCGAEHPLH